MSLCEEVDQHEIEIIMVCTAYAAACDASETRKTNLVVEEENIRVRLDYTRRDKQVVQPYVWGIYRYQLIFNDNFVLIFFQ